MSTTNDTTEKKSFWKRRVIGFPMYVFWILCLAVGWVLLGPIVIAICNSTVDGFANSGQIGDTIGGTSAPAIGLISAILIYFSFNEQIKANKKVQKQIDMGHQEVNFQFTISEFNILTEKFNIIPVTRYSGKGYTMLHQMVKNIRIDIDNANSGIISLESDLLRFQYLLFELKVFINRINAKDYLSETHLNVLKQKLYVFGHSELRPILEEANAWPISSPTRFNVYEAEHPVITMLDRTRTVRNLSIDVSTQISSYRDTVEMML